MPAAAIRGFFLGRDYEAVAEIVRRNCCLARRFAVRELRR